MYFFLPPFVSKSGMTSKESSGHGKFCRDKTYTSAIAHRKYYKLMFPLPYLNWNYFYLLQPNRLHARISPWKLEQKEEVQIFSPTALYRSQTIHSPLPCNLPINQSKCFDWKELLLCAFISVSFGLSCDGKTVRNNFSVTPPTLPSSLTSGRFRAFPV